MAAAPRRLACGAGDRSTGEGVKILPPDPVLLADPHGLEPPVPHVIPHRPDMETQHVRHLLDRIHLLRHDLSVPKIRLNQYIKYPIKHL